MVGAWLRAFLLTQVVEMGVYVHVTGTRPLRERAAIAFGASAITHVAVWFVIPEAVNLGVASLGWELDWRARWWTAIAVAETFALTTEAVWLWMFGVRPAQAFLASLLANGSSFTFGLFLYERGGW